MDFNNFERDIKTIFKHDQPDLDHDAIWDNIEPRLKKKKKRRFFIWFFWGAGLGLSLLLLRNVLDNAQNRTSATPLPSEITHQKSLQKDNVSGAKAQDVAQAGIAKGVHDVAQTNVVKDFKKNKGIKAENIVDIPYMLSEVEFGHGPFASHKPVISRSAKDLLAVIDQNSNSASDTKFEAQLTSPAMALLSAKSIGDYSVRLNVEPTKIQYLEKGKEGKESRKRKKSQKKPTTVHNKNRKKPWTEEISVFAGPSYAFRQLTNKGGSAEYLEARKKSESSIESFNAGFLYAVMHKKGFGFKAGFEYRQINEQYKWTYQTTETTTADHALISQTIDAQGNVLDETFGSKSITTIRNYSNTYQNAYRFVNLPIGAAYRTSGKKIRREISAGFDINLLFRANATFNDIYNTPTLYKSNSQDYFKIFKRTVGLGVWAAIGWDRKINKRLYCQAKGQIQVPLSAITQNDFMVSQRYFNIGIQLGIVHKLGVDTKKYKK